VLALASKNIPEAVLFVIGLSIMGGPPAIIAYLRGRTPVGWFLLGTLIAALVIMLFPEQLRAKGISVIPAIILAPILLLLLPRRGQRKPRRQLEPEDWSSTAIDGPAPARDPKARARRQRGPQP
jgi:hypothetical protein